MPTTDIKFEDINLTGLPTEYVENLSEEDKALYVEREIERVKERKRAILAHKNAYRRFRALCVKVADDKADPFHLYNLAERMTREAWRHDIESVPRVVSADRLRSEARKAVADRDAVRRDRLEQAARKARADVQFLDARFH